MVSGVNADSGFMRKSRFSIDRNKVDTPPPLMYTSVLSRDSFHIMIITSTLNGLDVECADVQNAYLNAKPK